MGRTLPDGGTRPSRSAQHLADAPGVLLDDLRRGVRGHVVADDQLQIVVLLTEDGLKDVARYAAGIGPAKDLVIKRTVLGALDASTGLVGRCHANGLLVHPWTFRAENFFLPLGMRRGVSPRKHGDLARELDHFLAEGVDGLFCDFPGIARAVIDGQG